jgi:hypothetical protein
MAAQPVRRFRAGSWGIEGKDRLLVPSQFVGAWRRSGLLISGKRRVDHCDVLWLQSEEWFADIRLPLIDGGSVDPADVVATHFSRPRAFIGRSSWDCPIFRWEHILDTADVVSRSDANMVQATAYGISEHGEWALEDGTTIKWCEEWTRLSASCPEVVMLDDMHRFEISCDTWTIQAIDHRPRGSLRICRSDFCDDRWMSIGSVASRR